jgi:hypothetical protein
MPNDDNDIEDIIAAGRQILPSGIQPLERIVTEEEFRAADAAVQALIHGEHPDTITGLSPVRSGSGNIVWFSQENFNTGHLTLEDTRNNSHMIVSPAGVITIIDSRSGSPGEYTINLVDLLHRVSQLEQYVRVLQTALASQIDEVMMRRAGLSDQEIAELRDAAHIASARRGDRWLDERIL